MAHNSFVQSFVETGVIGGTMFVGAIYVPILMLWQTRNRIPSAKANELTRWNGSILAMCAGYAVGMFSLSRNYIIPAYLPAGMASATAPSLPAGIPR